MCRASGTPQHSRSRRSRRPTLVRTSRRTSLIDFTPELHAKALQLVRTTTRWDPCSVLAVVSKADGPRTVCLSVDPMAAARTGQAVDTILSSTSPSRRHRTSWRTLGLVQPPDRVWGYSLPPGSGRPEIPVIRRPWLWLSLGRPKSQRVAEQRLNAILAKQGATDAGSAAAPIRTIVDGLPIVKPPYGVLSAINLDKGDLMWSVPHGDTPDAVRNNPDTQGAQHSQDRTARQRRPLVTKTLVIVGDPASHDDARSSARGDVAGLRQEDGTTGRSSVGCQPLKAVRP